MGIALSGTFLAAIFTGHLTSAVWTADQTAEFRLAVTWGGIALTALTAGLVAFGMFRARAQNEPHSETA